MLLVFSDISIQIDFLDCCGHCIHLFTTFKNLHLFISVFVYMYVVMKVLVQSCIGQRPVCGSQFSSSNTLDPGIYLRLGSRCLYPLSHLAILLTPLCIFLRELTLTYEKTITKLWARPNAMNPPPIIYYLNKTLLESIL